MAELLNLPVSLDALRLPGEMQAAMFDFLARLIATPSLSGEEGAAADVVLAELKTLGITDVIRDSAGSILATIGPGDGPTLLLDAHLDTVHVSAPWPHDPHDPIVRDGIMYGLGACDAKAAIAAMLYTASHLKSLGLPGKGTLALAFVVNGEPCEGAAIRHLLEETGLAPDAVVLGEPTAGQVVRGHRGRIMFRVSVRGRSSHASQPERGINAVTAAARLIFGLDLMGIDFPTDPFFGPGTVAVTRVESRSPAMNAIPDQCDIYIDRRLTAGETATRAESELDTVVIREGVEVDIEVTAPSVRSYLGGHIEPMSAYPAWKLPREHPLVDMALNILLELRDEEPRSISTPFSTDGAYTMGQRAIPTIAFGPGHPEHVHTEDDQVVLADVVTAAQVYAALAVGLGQDG